MQDLLYGFTIFFSDYNLLYCMLGVFLGTAVGVLPGIGALSAVSMLLPVTFYLGPTTSLVMLAGVYYGAEYGGAVASVLLNLPGTPASAVVSIEGYQMTKQGRSGIALFMSAISSFVGGTIGILLLMLMTPLIVRFSLALGPADYFCVMLIGLIASGAVAGGSALKGMSMVLLGLMLGMVGTDVLSGTVRYSSGMLDLYDGIDLVAMVMGLFGVSEVIASLVGGAGPVRVAAVSIRSMIPTREDVRRCILPVLRGAGIGSLLGALPGTGPTLASFISYSTEKQMSREPGRFGKGAIEGVAGPEASNNSAAQTAFIPTLALGIPGTPTMAIMIGALMLHGITPGPRMVSEHSDIFWGVVASFWVGNLLLLLLNVPLVGIWVNLVRIPQRLLYPGILCLICFGVYSVNTSSFDVLLVLAFGLLGYVLRLLDFHPAPLLVGFVLGPLMEENFRRAMLIARGDFLALFTRPISGALLTLAIALLIFSVWSGYRRRRRPQAAE